MFFLGGNFLARAIDQILSRVDLRFFLPPSLPITLSSHLNRAISTLYPRPRSSFSEISISNSLFFSFLGRGTLHNTSILSTYTYTPIFRDAERRESKTRRGPRKEKEKKTSFLVSAVFEQKHTHIHTSLPTYLIVSPKPPSVFKRI